MFTPYVITPLYRSAWATHFAEDTAAYLSKASFGSNCEHVTPPQTVTPTQKQRKTGGSFACAHVPGSAVVWGLHDALPHFSVLVAQGKSRLWPIECGTRSCIRYPYERCQISSNHLEKGWALSSGTPSLNTRHVTIRYVFMVVFLRRSTCRPLGSLNEVFTTGYPLS